MNLLRFAPALGAASLLCLAAACGGSSDNDGSNSGSTSSTSSTTPTGGGGGGGGETGGGGAGGDGAGGSSLAQPKGKLLEALREASRTGKVRFGQENSILWGLYDESSSQIVTTNDWFSSHAAAASQGKRPWSSDAKTLVGKNPSVFGVSIDAMVFDPVPWNRRDIVASAAAYMVDQPGGVVTMDWHAPSCAFDIHDSQYMNDIATPLATVSVDGHDVPIYAGGGGTPFYAEAYYTKPITSVADVPENLKCICKIANDVPIERGNHAGLSARTWLVAHAKYIADFFRTHGLGDKPIILRPFHEYTGGWFWWGQPYWNCQALLNNPKAVSGPDAYRAAYRTFADTIRKEPGMENVIFAHSTDKLAPLSHKDLSPAERKLSEPDSLARDLLRASLAKSLSAIGAKYDSPLEGAILASSGPPTSDMLQKYYVEAYPGDDVIDVLGIDLYYPYERAPIPADLTELKSLGSAVAAVAKAHNKPYALTEVGTYRLHLLYRVSHLTPGASLPLYTADYVNRSLQTIVDPSQRTEFLSHYGLTAAADVALSSAEVTSMFPNAGHGNVTEDWYNTHLLDLIRSGGFAYALTWQSYFDGGNFGDKSIYYYVPFPGHPEEASFRRFAQDPTVCFDGVCK